VTGFQQSEPARPTGPVVPIAGRRFHAYTAKHLDELTARAGLSPAERLAVRAVATVLPFRTNAYVVDNLIDWDAAPADPIYRLVFPQADMLPEVDVGRMAMLLAREAPDAEVRAAAHEVRMGLNPHPAGQLALNTPALNDEPLPGLQHKYPETVLIFPKQGQTCHAYCTYCFRWAQFVDEPDLKMSMGDAGLLVTYLLGHPEVTGVLVTGGDPMIMGAPVLRRYIEPLLDPRLDSLESIRIGSKSLGYWPQRFVTDPDADDTLALFEEVVALFHGALLASAGTRITDRRRGGAQDPGHRRGHPYPGAAHPVHQRRCGDLGRHVAQSGPDGHDPVLHVCGARHRSAGLLRRAAGPRP